MTGPDVSESWKRYKETNGSMVLFTKGWSLLLKPETPNKQDYQLYFTLHVDFILQKQRGNYWVEFGYVMLGEG